MIFRGFQALEAEVKSEISRPGHDSAMACAHPFAFQSPPKETSPAAYVPPLPSSLLLLLLLVN